MSNPWIRVAKLIVVLLIASGCGVLASTAEITCLQGTSSIQCKNESLCYCAMNNPVCICDPPPVVRKAVLMDCQGSSAIADCIACNHCVYVNDGCDICDGDCVSCGIASICCPVGQEARCDCNGPHYAECRCENPVHVKPDHSEQDDYDAPGCSGINGPCQTERDCCYQCTGVYCIDDMCDPGTCYPRGHACDAGCECCSGSCDKSEFDPGTCE